MYPAGPAQMLHGHDSLRCLRASLNADSGDSRSLLSIVHLSLRLSRMISLSRSIDTQRVAASWHSIGPSAALGFGDVSGKTRIRLLQYGL